MYLVIERDVQGCTSVAEGMDAVSDQRGNLITRESTTYRLLRHFVPR